MFEERFENWWDKNSDIMGLCQISKHTAKTIWMAGKDEGFKVGFDKGREMGKAEGRKEATRENW